ncbi:dihydrolipoyl dehydrogenase family protein [Marinicellulosiphila megalodicopiae]|uniref:dihydrolipoyl dehydrogenase family protein n=1 Tax=Marinicellulosiphila megalodicopiae TaxID=2724896 RepID=UPI003BAF1233
MNKKQNLVVIGAGAGGLVSAYIAAAVKANVTLIEANLMGGDCLNYGCVPSKALIHIADQMKQSQLIAQTGMVDSSFTQLDFTKVMAQVKGAIAQIQPKDSIERYRELGVNVIHGKAKILSPTQVEVTGTNGKEIIDTKHIIIATGGKPKLLNIEGLKPEAIYTSETIWNLEQLPKNLLIVGGGAIACELGQAFRRLGSHVSLLTRSGILSNQDPQASQIIERVLETEGVNIYKQCKDFKVNEENMTFTSLNVLKSIKFDAVLMATGKTGNSEYLGLENTNIITNEQNYIPVNAYNQTTEKSIYAVGDITGGAQFTHTAAHGAWFATVNSLFGRFKRYKYNLDNVPFAIFTNPQLATIGRSEAQLIQNNIEFDLTELPINENDKMICNNKQEGLIKVWTKKDTDKVLGVVIVGDQASELMPQWVWLMKQNAGLNTLMGMPHIYPSYNEINKAIAGKWKLTQSKKPKTQFLLSIVKWMHDRSVK